MRRSQISRGIAVLGTGSLRRVHLLPLSQPLLPFARVENKRIVFAAALRDTRIACAAALSPRIHIKNKGRYKKTPLR
jgi:hypothetical protein